MTSAIRIKTANVVFAFLLFFMLLGLLSSFIVLYFSIDSSNLKESWGLETWTRLIGLQCYALLVFEMKNEIFGFEEEEDCEDCDCDDCEDEE